MFVIVITRSGVNTGVHVRDSEYEVKALYPNVVWQDYGYKQGAHFDEYTSLDLFKTVPQVSGNGATSSTCDHECVVDQPALDGAIQDLRSELEDKINDLDTKIQEVRDRMLEVWL